MEIMHNTIFLLSGAYSEVTGEVGISLEENESSFCKIVYLLYKLDVNLYKKSQ